MKYYNLARWFVDCFLFCSDLIDHGHVAKISQWDLGRFHPSIWCTLVVRYALGIIGVPRKTPTYPRNIPQTLNHLFMNGIHHILVCWGTSQVCLGLLEFSLPVTCTTRSIILFGKGNASLVHGASIPQLCTHLGGGLKWTLGRWSNFICAYFSKGTIKTKNN